MSTRRPLTITAVAAGIGTVVALTLGPMASAATTTAARHDLRASAATATADKGSSSLSLADTGVDLTPYAVSGLGSLVIGVGLVCAARRFASWGALGRVGTRGDELGCTEARWDAGTGPWRDLSRARTGEGPAWDARGRPGPGHDEQGTARAGPGRAGTTWDAQGQPEPGRTSWDGPGGRTPECRASAVASPSSSANASRAGP